MSEKRKLEDASDESKKHSSLTSADQDLVDALTLSSQACVQAGLAYLTSSNSVKMSPSNLLAVAPLCLAGNFEAARQAIKGMPVAIDFKERRAEAGEMGKSLKAIYQRIRDNEEGLPSKSSSSASSTADFDVSQLLPYPSDGQTFRRHRVASTGVLLSALPLASVSTAVLIAWSISLLDEYDQEPKSAAGDSSSSPRADSHLAQLFAQLTAVLTALSERTYVSSSKSYLQHPDTVISLSDLPYGNVGASPLDAMFPLVVLSRFASLFPSLFPSLPSSPSLLSRILSTAYTLAQRGDQEGSSHGAVLFNRRNEPVSVGWNHRYPLAEEQARCERLAAVAAVAPAHKAKKGRPSESATGLAPPLPVPRCKVVHAETHAILQLPEDAWPEDVEGGSVWVVELAAGGGGDGSGRDKDKGKDKVLEPAGRTFLDAFPCPNCTSAMTKLGVRRAFFTKMDGRVGAWFMGEKKEGIGAETFEFVKKNDTFARLQEAERKQILGQLQDKPPDHP